MTTDYVISRHGLETRTFERATSSCVYLDEDLDRLTRISVHSGREFTITLEDLIAVLRQREITTAQAFARREAVTR